VAVKPIRCLLPSALNLGTGISESRGDTDPLAAGSVPCLLVGDPTKAMLKPIDAVWHSHHRTTKIGLAIRRLIPISWVLVLSS
jgi:hypothetical protein